MRKLLVAFRNLLKTNLKTREMEMTLPNNPSAKPKSAVTPTNPMGNKRPWMPTHYAAVNEINVVVCYLPSSFKARSNMSYAQYRETVRTFLAQFGKVIAGRIVVIQGRKAFFEQRLNHASRNPVKNMEREVKRFPISDLMQIEPREDTQEANIEGAKP